MDEWIVVVCGKQGECDIDVVVVVMRTRRTLRWTLELSNALLFSPQEDLETSMTTNKDNNNTITDKSETYRSVLIGEGIDMQVSS